MRVHGRSLKYYYFISPSLTYLDNNFLRVNISFVLLGHQHHVLGRPSAWLYSLRNRQPSAIGSPFFCFFFYSFYFVTLNIKIGEWLQQAHSIALFRNRAFFLLLLLSAALFFTPTHRALRLLPASHTLVSEVNITLSFLLILVVVWEVVKRFSGHWTRWSHNSRPYLFRNIRSFFQRIFLPYLGHGRVRCFRELRSEIVIENRFF